MLQYWECLGASEQWQWQQPPSLVKRPNLLSWGIWLICTSICYDSDLTSAYTQHLSVHHQANCEWALVSSPNIVLGRCSLLNPLSRSCLVDDHDCTLVIEEDTRPQPDSSDVSDQNTDMIMFAAGSCTQNKNDNLRLPMQWLLTKSWRLMFCLELNRDKLLS